MVPNPTLQRESQTFPSGGHCFPCLIEERKPKQSLGSWACSISQRGGSEVARAQGPGQEARSILGACLWLLFCCLPASQRARGVPGTIFPHSVCTKGFT